MIDLAELERLAAEARDGEPGAWDELVDGHVFDGETLLALVRAARAAMEFQKPKRHWRADENFPIEEFKALQSALAPFREPPA